MNDVQHAAAIRNAIDLLSTVVREAAATGLKVQIWYEEPKVELFHQVMMGQCEAPKSVIQEMNLLSERNALRCGISRPL